MERHIIGRGLLAGAIAGVLAFIYARLFIEPVIGRAIGYEEGRGDAEAALTGAHEHGIELFSRDVQSWVGMGFGVVAFSVAMAGLFAVTFIVAYTRFPGLSARMTAAVLAAGAFVVVYLVPFLKYPANPPSVGDATTIRERSALYLVMIVASVASAVGAVWLGRRLVAARGAWGASLSAIGAYLVAVGVAMWALPSIAETPQPATDQAGRIVYPGFPADDLYHFRLYAVGTQVIIWATIGLVFGALVAKMLDSQRQQRISV